MNFCQAPSLDFIKSISLNWNHINCPCGYHTVLDSRNLMKVLRKHQCICFFFIEGKYVAPEHLCPCEITTARHFPWRYCNPDLISRQPMRPENENSQPHGLSPTVVTEAIAEWLIKFAKFENNFSFATISFFFCSILSHVHRQIKQNDRRNNNCRVTLKNILAIFAEC